MSDGVWEASPEKIGSTQFLESFSKPDKAEDQGPRLRHQGEV